jgi:calcineurin-like phosphoesterase family protein
LTRTWLTADPHFGHEGVCRFLRDDGTKLRPWDNPDDMDEALIKNWNDVVDDKDRVYLLGDVVINRRCLKTLERLKGRKVLVKGNHDIFKIEDYLKYFDDIRAYVVLHTAEKARKVILSHIPVHPDSVGRYGINIHGHLHSNKIDDPRYLCVSVEHTNFTPIEYGEALKLVPDAPQPN